MDPLLESFAIVRNHSFEIFGSFPPVSHNEEERGFVITVTVFSNEDVEFSGGIMSKRVALELTNQRTACLTPSLHNSSHINS